jgi:hypothetical protein
MKAMFLKAAIWPALALSTVAVAQQPKNCTDLAGLKIAGVEITKAALIPAVESSPAVPNYSRPYTGALPAYCRVEGIMNRRTGADGQELGIGFALALPENWNGDFEMEGGGGLNGTIYEPVGTQNAGGNPALKRGFAVATNDTGHKAKPGGGFDGGFQKDQQAVLDFAYLANAEIAGLAKQIIATYYGKPAAYSYFVGCSTGGREGMILSQRWPTVFNGIVSGDPAMRTGFSNLSIRSWMSAVYNQIAPKDASGKPIIAQAISDSDRKLFIASLLKECDALDGIADGMISNPMACHFDPAALTCKDGQTNDCLAAEKVSAIKKVFEGPKNLHGDPVYTSFLYDAGVDDANPGPGLLHPGAGVFGAPSTATTIDVDQLARRASNPLGDSLSTSLSTFAANGGKLIFYHGDSDPWFSPLDTLGYYKDMATVNGGLDKVLSWSQFYLVPGMTHCDGGPSLDKFDMLTAIVDWTEKGKSPESVIATGKAFPGRSRPLCAYPKHAQYRGSGDPQDAKNFSCVND